MEICIGVAKVDKKHYFVPVKQVVSKLRIMTFSSKALCIVLRGEMLIY